MSFQGLTFDGQNVSPKDDGALYQNHFADGILDGCSMTISGDNNSLVIDSGHFLAGGRVWKVDGSTSVDLSERTLTTGYIQIVANIDLTKEEGDQWEVDYVESTTTTFPDLTQEDINGTGNIYQMELAVVEISGGNLTDITSITKGSDIHIDGKTGSPMLRLGTNDGAKGYVYYDTVNAAERMWNPNGNNGYAAYDNGQVIVHANQKSIFLRPNGRTTQGGSFAVDQYGHLSQYTATGQTDNAYYMYDASGNCWGRIYGKSGNFKFAKYVSGTADKHGLDLRDGAIVLYGTNIPIYIRPQGSEVSTGQITLNSNGNVTVNGTLTATGDVRRTAKYYGNSASASTSISANTNKKVVSITGIEAGQYLISGAAHLALNSAGSCNMNFYKSADNSSRITYAAQYCKSSSAWIQNMTWASFNAGGVCSLYLEPNVAGTYDSVSLELLRLA